MSDQIDQLNGMLDCLIRIENETPCSLNWNEIGRNMMVLFSDTMSMIANRNIQLTDGGLLSMEPMFPLREEKS